MVIIIALAIHSLDPPECGIIDISLLRSEKDLANRIELTVQTNLPPHGVFTATEDGALNRPTTVGGQASQSVIQTE